MASISGLFAEFILFSLVAGDCFMYGNADMRKYGSTFDVFILPSNNFRDVRFSGIGTELVELVPSLTLCHDLAPFHLWFCIILANKVS